MPLYKYKALSPEKKTVTGLVKAGNMDAAADILSEKNLIIISMEEKKQLFKKKGSFFGKIKLKDVVIFSRQFSVLVSANVSLVQSLRILAEQSTNEKFKGIINSIASQVDSGSRLSDALGAYPKVFSDFYVSVVRSGETSGKLDEVLNYLADELEKDYDMTSKIKGAMIYPAFVLSGLIAVGIIMIVFIVPKLTEMMKETGGELPLSTRAIMGISDFVIGYWWLLLIILGILVGAFFYIRRTPQGRHYFSLLFLNLPVFGRLFRMIYLVRFTRSMDTLVKGGVNMSQSLEIAADVVGNRIFKELILDTKKQVEEGNSISTVFNESKYVPKMVPQMMLIGEKTGKLDLILEKITIFYGREIDNIVANLMTLMEPIIMIVMGVGVGIMVAAIVMPMYNMSSAIQ